MDKNSGRKDSLAGGLGILAVAACLCYKALRRMDARLRKKAEKKE